MRRDSARLAICVGLVTVGMARAISVSATDDAQRLVSELLGDGIRLVGTPRLVGPPDAAGLFSGGQGSGIGMESGVVLTSGMAVDARGPNGNADQEGVGPRDEFDEVAFGASTDHGFPGDADLDGLAADQTFDASILEFEFETRGGDLFFRYLFASEEYNDFVGAGFNDVFGFFLDGQNIALVPGTSMAVSVDTINPGMNSEFLNQNTVPTGSGLLAPFDVEYDGFTDVLVARKIGLGPGIHKIRLAVSDTGDGILDAAVFLESGSFTDVDPDGGGVPVPEPITASLGGIGLCVLLMSLGRR